MLSSTKQFCGADLLAVLKARADAGFKTRAAARMKAISAEGVVRREQAADVLDADRIGLGADGGGLPVQVIPPGDRQGRLHRHVSLHPSPEGQGAEQC